MSSPLLIIPVYIRTKTHGELLHRCVRSLRDTTDYPVILIDDCSPHTDQVNVLFEYFDRKYDDITFIKKEQNEGFSKTVNIGLKTALANNIDAVLVNSDIEFVDDNWLKEMQQTEADIIGARLLYPNRTIQHAGIYFSPITRGFDHRFKGAPENLPEALEYCKCPVTGALQYIRHSVLKDVGLYDEDFRLGYEDVDFMIRAIEKGHNSVYNPNVLAMHHESAFRKESSDEHRQWEKDSYKLLTKKHSNKNFRDIAPTMFEKNYA